MLRENGGVRTKVPGIQSVVRVLILGFFFFLFLVVVFVVVSVFFVCCGDWCFFVSSFVFPLLALLACRRAEQIFPFRSWCRTKSREETESDERQGGGRYFLYETRRSDEVRKERVHGCVVR